MTVLYSDRTTPIAANASNTAWSNNVVLAYDFTGIGALSEGVPWVYQGATSPTLVKTGTISQTTLNGEPTRKSVSGSSYDYNNTTDYGLQFGTGDFTLALRLNMPASNPGGSNGHEVLRISGSAGTTLSLNIIENPGVGWYLSATGSAAITLGTTLSAVFYPANTTVTIWVRRIGSSTVCFTQNTTAQTNAVARTNAATSTASVNSTRAARLYLNVNSGASSQLWGLAAFKVWNVGHSDATLSAIGKDFWDTEANVPGTIALTSPTTGSTIATNSTISGTYTGTAPSSVEVQHGAGSWVAGTSATIGGGTWSATFSLTAAASASLRARYGNAPAVVSADVAAITITADAIAFTVPGTPATAAVSYRMFQRNGSNQASVRITGTYSGTPTTIEYSWAGSAYSTLVASPAAGVFDQTVTLTGPAQGALTIRFSNATAVAASLVAVGVGDVYMVAGQSNNVGGGNGGYVPATAPSAHTGWVATEYAKNGTWRENVETVGTPFSSTTGAVYSVQAASANAFGSFFGALATKYMNAGVPVAFVPCALGSTSIDAWAVPTPATNTAALFGAMLTVANTIGSHKGVLWWQGEYETSGASSQATHESKLTALIDAWWTNAATPWFLINLNATGNGGNFANIHAAIAAVAASHAHVCGIADMNAAPLPYSTSIHYETGTEINAVAQRVWDTFDTASGVVTTVTADLAASYNLQGATSADAAASYNVRAAVAQDASAAYYIHAAVTADLDASYAVLSAGAVQSGLTAAYNIRAAATADLSAAYAISGGADVFTAQSRRRIGPQSLAAKTRIGEPAL